MRQKPEVLQIRIGPKLRKHLNDMASSEEKGVSEFMRNVIEREYEARTQKRSDGMSDRKYLELVNSRREKEGN